VGEKSPSALFPCAKAIKAIATRRRERMETTREFIMSRRNLPVVFGVAAREAVRER